MNNITEKNVMEVENLLNQYAYEFNTEECREIKNNFLEFWNSFFDTVDSLSDELREKNKER